MMKVRLAHLAFLGLIITLMFGCKHTEKVVIEKKVKAISVRRAVKLVIDNEIKFNTLSVKRVGLTINNDGDVNSFRAQYKIRKDSLVQISAQKLTIPVGKIEINPDSFKVVFHMGKFVMIESLQKISEFIGYDIDYQTIQSILCNHLQSIRQDQKDNSFKDYVLDIEENMYKISSIRERRFKKFVSNDEKLERFKQRKDEEHFIKQDIFIDPDIFVVRKVVFNDIDYGRIVTITFSEFMALGEKWFPGNIHILLSGGKPMDVKIELSRVVLDDEADFGFSIPPKYKREALKKK
jgi:hypothetical protein